MYEESVGIPLIVSGRDIPSGKVVSTQASLVDIHPTIMEATGEGLTTEDMNLPGKSLLDLVCEEEPGRTVLSEYHDGGSITGMFMIRRKNLKYICYPGYPPQLFDLEEDPHESTDLAQNSDYRREVEDCHRALSGLVDPICVNRQAFTEQAAKVEELGGRDGIESLENFDQSPVPDFSEL